MCINEKPHCTRATYDALERAGLATRNNKRGHDALGSYDIPVWTVAQWAHQQWCAWCAEQEKRR